MRRRSFLAALIGGVVGAKRSFAMATGMKPEWIQYSRLPPSEWVEGKLLPDRDYLRRAATAGCSVIFPLHPEFFSVSDVVHCPRTGENLLILSTGPTLTAIEVERGLGSVPCAMVKDEPLWILGNASHEGATSTRPESLQLRPTSHDAEQLRKTRASTYQRGQRSALTGKGQPTQYLSAEQLKEWIGE